MSRTFLSVHVNKYALLRNSRGRNLPNLLGATDTIVKAGAHGITVHPRRDERHIRLDDVLPLAEHLAYEHRDIELNIECENHPELIDLVLEARPAQCTLVPVSPGEVTSDHGFRMPDDVYDLQPTIELLKEEGIRVSLFADCVPEDIPLFKETGADRVELYTGPYAWAWGTSDQEEQTRLVWESAAAASAVGLGVNAGHDLDRHNLAGLLELPGLLEVSIGHAQICRALEVGTTRSVQELLAALGWASYMDGHAPTQL